MANKNRRFPQPVSIAGRRYIVNVPPRISCGTLLPHSFELPFEYLDVTDVQHGIDREIAGMRILRPNLISGQVSGDSMTGNDIRHGDTVIIEMLEFEQILYGRIALIEKIGDDEGSGSWALKKLVLVRDHSIALNSFGEISDWDSPIIELRSSNPRFPPRQLDPTGRYRVRGYLLRVLHPEDVKRISVEELAYLIETTLD